MTICLPEEEIAATFAHHGAKIIIVDLNREVAEAIASEIVHDHNFLLSWAIREFLPLSSATNVRRARSIAASATLSTSGKRGSSSSSRPTIAAATTRRANHLLSAGTTYHGAFLVAVERIASSKALI